jgi:hypothetical protein
VTDPDETIRRGQRAEQILNDDVFKSAIAAMKAAALLAFKTADPADIMALQTARLRFGVLDQIETDLKNTMRDGAFEKRKKDDAKPPLSPEDRFTPRHAFQQ